MNKNFSNTNVELTIDKNTAHQLADEARSFRHQCGKAIEDMAKAHLDKMMKKKGWKDNDKEKSEQEILAYFADQRKYSLSGWHLAPYNPNQLVAIFQCLHLRNGYHLESFQGMDKSGNGSSFIFVIPDNRTLPKRAPQKFLDDLFFMSSYGESDNTSNWRSLLRKVCHYLIGIAFPSYRSLPKWTDMVIENYIEGDESPLSYFQVSMFLREVAELGAMWHNVYWGHHKLVTSLRDLPDEEWTWQEPEPREWCPVVWKDKDQRWNVTFHTINEMDADLVFHKDTFINGYRFKTYSTSIAHYPGGYVV